MPHFGGNPFNGPNFSVNNDRVLDHLRVRQPNTFKLPPATKKLIDPNILNDADKLVGDNNPVTNSTLRSGVAQAGALVYCTTPILNPLWPALPTDGCFDNRNHLYFSDGDQWIPLANCLPSSEPSSEGNCCGESLEIEGDNGGEDYVLKTADSGKRVFFTGDAPLACHIILPEISLSDPGSLCYTFINGSDYVGAQRNIVVYPGLSPPTADLLFGSINYIQNGGVNTEPPSTDNTITHQSDDTATPGDFSKVYSRDGKWVVTGECWVNDAIIFQSLPPP